MNNVTIFLFILLALGGCVPEDELTPSRVASSADADFAYHDVSQQDIGVDAPTCATQCGLKVSTPPQQNQPLVSESVFTACRELSREMCVNPGEVLSPYVATVFLIDREACGPAATFCINRDAGVLAVTVKDASYFKDALAAALYHELAKD